jgi:ABC-type multidrug transport system permease subunit
VVQRGLRSYQAGEAAYLGLWPEDRPDKADSNSIELLESYFEGDFAAVWNKWRRADEDPVWLDFRSRVARVMDRQVALGDALGGPAVVLNVRDKVPVEESVESGEVNLFNYFLPTFAVFFLMFAVSAATRDIHRERALGTLQRQLLSPLAGMEFVLGKWLSATLQGSLQLMVLFLAGALLFRVNLGSDPWSLPLAVLLTCTTASGFFLFLSLLCRNEKMSDSLSTIVVLVSAMLGGNLVPVDTLPDWVRSIGQIFFNYWANLSFSQILVSNEGLFEHPLPALVLSGATVVLMAASVLVFLIRHRRGGLL